jgi:hypothetical protein
MAKVRDSPKQGPSGLAAEEFQLLQLVELTEQPA